MDDILKEVRRIREAYGEQFGFDISAIFHDMRERGRERGREVVSLPPRRIVPTLDVPLGDDDDIDPGSGLTSTVAKSS